MTSNIYLNQSTTVEQYFKTIKIVNSNLLLYVVADLQQTQQSQYRRREKNQNYQNVHQHSKLIYCQMSFLPNLLESF